jgi:plastocyanin
MSKPRSRLRGRLARVGAVMALTTSICVVALPSTSGAETEHKPKTVVIGVDHEDPANQQPQHSRVFEYTDFFSREAKIHTGDTIDFRTAPGTVHDIGLAATEQGALAAYPGFLPDTSDPKTSAGSIKVITGPSNLSVHNGTLSGGGSVTQSPPCGIDPLPKCVLASAKSVEIAGIIAAFDQKGVPTPVNWKLKVNAPTGHYQMFCVIHPGMRGAIDVVPKGEETTSQAEINARSATQFAQSQAAALAAEKAANVPRFTGEEPGQRTYQVNVGVSAANNHVAILEMLPKLLHVVAGDRVAYRWPDPHEAHNVIFPDKAPDPEPFVFDCGATTQTTNGQPCFESGEPPTEPQPEVIGDPGNSPPGTVLTSTNTAGPPFVDSGLLFGTGYGVPGTIQHWSVRTTAAQTPAGTYSWHCSLHDFMHGDLIVSPAEKDNGEHHGSRSPE